MASPKSFIPQATRLARKLNLYLTKHSARMYSLSGDATFNTLVANLITALQAVAAYYVAEEP